MGRARVKVALAGLVVLAVAGGGVAVLEDSSQASPQVPGPAGTVSPAQFAQGTAKAVLATAVDATDAQAFGVLDRAVAPTDALPAIEGGTLSSGPLAGVFGANLSLARAADGFASGGAWVVPGDGSVCLVADPTYSPGVTSTAHLTGGVSCQFDSDALNGELTMTGSTGHDPGHFQIAGLVPNGVKTVTVSLASGATQTLPVNDNVYMADLDAGIDNVSYTTSTGQPITINESWT